MENLCFYAAGHTPAQAFAIRALRGRGIAFTDDPSRANKLLLPVPAFDPDGSIRGGGFLPPLMEQLPEDVLVIGGGLDSLKRQGSPTLDLLEDPFFTAQNAHITACCALRIIQAQLPVVLTGLPVLVIGWGRIGKCLCQLLGQSGAKVTVAARKEADRAMAQALGYQATTARQADTAAYRVIFNTVPEMILPICPGNALKVDLASRPGIGGLDVVSARGLPGRYAPESAGNLIAESILRLICKEDSL